MRTGNTEESSTLLRLKQTSINNLQRLGLMQKLEECADQEGGVEAARNLNGLELIVLGFNTYQLYSDGRCIHQRNIQ